MRAGKIASQCARKLNFGTLVEAFLFPQFLFFFNYPRSVGYCALLNRTNFCLTYPRSVDYCQQNSNNQIVMKAAPV